MPLEDAFTIATRDASIERLADDIDKLREMRNWLITRGMPKAMYRQMDNLLLSWETQLEVMRDHQAAVR